MHVLGKATAFLFVGLRYPENCDLEKKTHTHTQIAEKCQYRGHTFGSLKRLPCYFSQLFTNVSKDCGFAEKWFRDKIAEKCHYCGHTFASLKKYLATFSNSLQI